MTSEGHVLALLGSGPSGRFTHDAWTIESEIGLGDLPMILASCHEAHHAALNASTSWGAVLQAVALAGRFATGEPSFRKTIVDLVRVTRHTHEAYATHASVMDVVRAGGAAGPTELLAGYPGYRAHLDDAVRLGPPTVFTNAWRQVAAESALQACMQSPALTVLLSEGLDRFTLASVRRHDHPDWRLTVLAKSIPAWWREAADIAAAALGVRWDLLSGLDVRDRVARTARLSATWIELRRLCIDAALRALRREGCDSLSTVQVGELLPALTREVARVTGGTSPLTLDTDTATGAFGLFEMEAVQLGARRTAYVGRLGDTSSATFQYGSGTDRHAYVVVRHRRHLEQRFAITAGADLPAGDAPVVAVHSHGADPASVRLTVIPDPEALRGLAMNLPVPLLASVSLACTLDDEWRDRWTYPLQRLTTSTLLLDLPFTQSLDALLGSGEPFAYTLVSTGSGAARHTAFACRLGDDPPLLLPCTLTTGQAFVQYAHRGSPARLEPQMAALDGRLDAVRLVVAHLVEEEGAIGNLSGDRSGPTMPS